MRTCVRMGSPPYVELHCHSAFSFLDGASLPDEFVPAALELGYEALALTDHNTVSGSMEFAVSARALGLRPIHGAEIDLDRRAPPDAARRGCRRLVEPVPHPDPRARAHARKGTRPPAPIPASQAFVELSGRPWSRRGAGLPERLRAARGARRVHAPAPARGVRTRSPAGRATAAVPARRSRAQPPPPASRGDGWACRAWRRGTCTRTRASGLRSRTRWSPCACTPRSMPPSPSGEATSAMCSPRRRRWRAAFPSTPRRWRRPWRLAERLRFDLTSDLGYRYPGAEDAEAMRKLTELCQDAPGRSLQGRGRRCVRSARRAAGAGAADHRAARSAWVLPAPPRHAGAGARGGARGARARQRPQPAAARPGPRLERLVDRLLPDRPLARRPDRERPADRAVPERGADLAARHRPRLPARHQGEADPARPRALRPRPLGAGGSVPDLPRPRGDPRARQGAGAAAGEIERVARGSEGWDAREVGQDIEQCSSRASGVADAGLDGSLGVARAAGRRGPRPAAPPQPALGRDDRRHPSADRLLPDRAGGDGGPPDRSVGQGLLLGRGLPEDRPARARDAVGGRAVRSS